MARLGGTVISTESAGEYSSAAKGETLEGACAGEGCVRRGGVCAQGGVNGGLGVCDKRVTDGVGYGV